MGQTQGHIQLQRAVASIMIGHRHRTDLGDIDALAASIAQLGLLQPPTITTDGTLVCGARRLAAVKQLGWRTVDVWVRSSISDRLGHLLAEQDENTQQKDLTPVEAAALYGELKTLMAEDASQRESATQFSSEHQPRWNGSAKFADPLGTPRGEARAQAAGMIPGGASHTTLDKITYLQQLATDPETPPALREQITAELEAINDGAPVHPAYERIRALQQREAMPARGTDLQSMADEAIARAHRSKDAPDQPAGDTPETGDEEPVAKIIRWPLRAFIATWSELENWWIHYNAEALAAELSEEQIESFLATAEGTSQFARDLRAARDAHDEGARRGHLRAL
ncbi:ParB N-terminal domain-containing protein [Auritidibacter ignavus]|uniref:ParB N-terminal domain-containing protein n=1 Tax=Auritidibacter ignavus TaxID=678932 RepID=UPI00244D3106|nr:ParB N-terminal domain-containing protein [Auritidibacter ignavus]WGH82670.1 ParB N-terminal domain-containing protein [Auritidibacter ignavus]